MLAEYKGSMKRRNLLSSQYQLLRWRHRPRFCLMQFCCLLRSFSLMILLFFGPSIPSFVAFSLKTSYRERKQSMKPSFFYQSTEREKLLGAVISNSIRVVGGGTSTSINTVGGMPIGSEASVSGLGSSSRMVQIRKRMNDIVVDKMASSSEDGSTLEHHNSDESSSTSSSGGVVGRLEELKQRESELSALLAEVRREKLATIRSRPLTIGMSTKISSSTSTSSKLH
jgi:hypothetical protein